MLTYSESQAKQSPWRALIYRAPGLEVPSFTIVGHLASDFALSLPQAVETMGQKGQSQAGLILRPGCASKGLLVGQGSGGGLLDA